MARAILLALLTIAALAPSTSAWIYHCHSSLDGYPLDPFCPLHSAMLLQAQTQPEGVYLSWQPPRGAADDVAEYWVQRYSPGEDEPQEFSAGLALSHLDVPPNEGVFVYYVVAEFEEESDGKSRSNPVVAAWPYCQPAGVLPLEYNSGCVTPLPGGLGGGTGLEL